MLTGVGILYGRELLHSAGQKSPAQRQRCRLTTRRHRLPVCEQHRLLSACDLQLEDASEDMSRLLVLISHDMCVKGV